MPNIKRMELYSATPSNQSLLDSGESTPYKHKYTGDVKSFLEEECKNPPNASAVKPYYSHCHTCNHKNLEFEQINDGVFGRKFSEEYWKLKIRTVEKKYYSSLAANSKYAK
jgi:hypothetical protein